MLKYPKPMSVQIMTACNATLDGFTCYRTRRHPQDELTPREHEVLSLMAEGLSNAGIARRLVVTEGAVEKHVTSIFAKLGLEPAETDHRRVLAVLRYLEDR